MSLLLEHLRRGVLSIKTWLALAALVAFFSFLIYWTLGIIDPHSKQAATVAQLVQPEAEPEVSEPLEASDARDPGAGPTGKPGQPAPRIRKPQPKAYLKIVGLPPEDAIVGRLKSAGVDLVAELPTDSSVPAGTLQRSGQGPWELRQEFINWIIANISGQTDLETLVQKSFTDEYGRKVDAWISQGPPEVQASPQVWLIPQFREGADLLRAWVMGLSALCFGGLLTAGIGGTVERWRSLGQAWAEASAPTPLWQRLWARAFVRCIGAGAAAGAGACLWAIQSGHSLSLGLIGLVMGGAGALLAGGIAHLPFALSRQRWWWRLAPTTGYLLAIGGGAVVWKFAFYPHLVWIVHHPALWCALTLASCALLNVVLLWACGRALERKGRLALEP